MPSHPSARGSRRAILPRRRHRPRIEALETRQLLAVDFRSVVGIEAARIEGRATAVDAVGNSYVAGVFAGTADFDPGTGSTLLTGAGPGDGFVAKYSPAGTLVWARSFGGPGMVEATALQLDGSGNVILAGNFDGTADFDPGAGTANLTADGGTDGFALKLSPAGDYVWSARLGGPGSLRVAGLALGPVGGLYVVGAFTGTADLDPAAIHADGSDLLTSLGATDGFAAKITASGTFGWATRLGGPSVDEAAGVVQQGPHVIVGGTFSGAVDFDARSYAASWETSSGGSDDGYVTWLTTEGEFVKVSTLGGAGPDRVTGVGADAEGNVYVAGSFAGTADFAPKQTFDGSKDLLASVGPEDAFVARLDYGGTFGWVRRFGGAAGSRTMALAVDASGVSAAGWFRGTGVVFDAIPDSTRPLTLSSRGERDGFALHLSAQGNLAWARSLGGEADDTPRAVASQRSGQVTVAGETLGPASFGTRAIAAAGQALFAARLIETSDDYDGDGLADVATYRPATGQWAILPSTTAIPRLDNLIVTPSAGDRPVPLDYDGDGRTDKAVYRPSDSSWFILQSSNNTLVTIQFGQGTIYGGSPVPIVGDFDGDGRSDVGVFERSTAKFNLRRSRDGNLEYQFGQGTIYAGNPVPVVGDFDGDFRCDFGVYQPASLSIDRHSSSEGDSRITFDPATSYGANPVPLVGDFDGDGRADVGLFGPAESKFWVRQPSGVQTMTQFGQGTLYGGTPRPVIADYDFDGRSDLGVFQRVKPAGATTNWALSQSGGVNRLLSVGQDNDIPLPPPAEVPTMSGSLAGPATFGGDGGSDLTLGGGSGPDPGTSGYVPPSGGGGAPQTPPMVTVRFATPYLKVDEGTSGKLVLLRSVTGGTLDNITTEVRLSIVTPLDATLATKAVDYTSNVLQSIAEYQVIFGPGITSKDIDFNALADDLTNEGNQGVLLQIGSLRSTNYAQSQVGTPSEGEFFIPEYPPPTGGSTGGGSTGGGSTGGGSTGGGSTGGGSTGGGSTGGGSTGTNTDPVPNFGAASVVLNDNADFLSTGESPLGITDGPVWIGASSGDVLVAPNRIATRGAGHLPEWRSDQQAGELVVTLDWTLPTNVAIGQFTATLTLGLQPGAPLAQSAPQTFSTTNLALGQTVRFSLRVNAIGLATGLYGWKVEINASSAGGAGAPKATFGASHIINRTMGPLGGYSTLGAGWWVPDLDLIVPRADPALGPGFSWVRGDGTAAFFATDAAGNFPSTPPEGSFFTLAYANPASPATSPFVLRGPDGLVLNFARNGLLTSRTERHGNTTTYSYTDANGDGRVDDLAQVVDPFGRATTFHYGDVDPGPAVANRLTDVEDFAGRRVNYTYNAGGSGGFRPSRIDWPDGDAGRPSTWVEFDYDPAILDRVIRVRRPDGREAQILFDDAGVEGRRGLTRSVGGVPLASWSVSPLQRRTLAVARPTTGPDALYTDPLGFTTLIRTDRFGYLTGWTDPLGRTTTLGRDQNGQVISRTTPDPDGLGPLAPATTTYSYDSRGRITTMTLPAAGPGDATVTRQWTYSTQAWESPTSFIDELGRTSGFTLNATTGDVTATTDPLLRLTQSTFTGRGLPAQLTSPDPDGTGPLGVQVSTTAYQHLTRADLPTKLTAPDGTIRTIEYDGLDRPWRLTDALNRVTLIEYDGFDRPVRVTAPDPDPADAVGPPVEEYRYNAHGELVQVTGADPDGAGPQPRPVTDYTYDGLGRPTRVVGPVVDASATPVVRPEWNFSYDAADHLVAATDPLLRTTFYGFDPAGQLAGVVDAAGGVTRLTYDGLGRLIARVDPLGRLTTAAYDARDRLTRTVDARGGVSTATYDAVGNRLTATDALGRVTSYAYDPANRLVQLTLPDPDGPTGSLPAPVYNYEYDTLDRPTRILGVDPDGSGTGLPRPETVYTYFHPALHQYTVALPDPDGAGTAYTAPTTTYGSDAAGNLTSVTDPLGRVTTYAYDRLDRLTRVTLPDPDGAGSQPAPVSALAYDAAGRLVATARTDVQALAAAQPPLEQASYAYDGLGRLVAQADFRGTLASTYDAAGRLTATTDRLGRVTSYAYDALDRLTRVTAPDPDGNPATPNTPVWAFAYDAAGQRRLAIDPAGARTATAYDDAGAVALVRDPVGSATRFARDAVGNLIRVADPLGNTTTTTFDALDRPVREQVGFTAADRTFAYDAAGNLDRVKDRNGRVIDFDADNLGRTISEKWLPAGGTVPIRTLTSTYTATGQLQGVVDSDVVDSSFTYDALDRPVTETTGLHGSLAPSTSFSFTLTATYDAADRRTGLADSRGGLATYGYDGAGRMISASLVAGGVAGPAVTLGYDANDRLTDIGRRVGTAGRSILSRLTYDAAGRLITIEHADSADTAWGGDTPLASFEDTLDAAGRVTSTIGTNRTGGNETRSYGYDAAGQIVSQAVTGQATTSFAYDAAGNRTAGTTIQPGNRLAEDATYRYVYDAEGNLTRREEKANSRVREYAWDHRNRLTGVTDRDTAAGPVTQQVSFVYDAFDRRVGKIVDADGSGPLSATKRWTMYEGQDAYADLDAAGAVQSRYLHGPAVDMLLARLDADTTATWYLPDRLGSTRALARIGSTSAQVLDRIDYDAFGTASESTPSAGDRFMFTGREYDAETGLYYYRARYYDAGTGRFVGEDPSGFAGGDANLYRYVGNSPTNLVDPSGLQAQATSGGGGGGGGVARPGDGEWERGYAGYYGAANTTATRPIAGQRHRYYRDTGASSPEEMGGVPTDPNGSFLNSLATPAGSSSGFTPQAWNSIGGYLNLNVRATGDDTVSDYLEQSARQVVLGEYHIGTATALGTTAQIGLAFTGLDAAADVRDTVHNVTHWKSTPGHITKTIFGAAAILPLVGGLFKMVDKLGDANRGIRSAVVIHGSDDAAHSAINASALRDRLTAQEISGGHAFDKHVLERGEFPGTTTRQQFAGQVEDVIRNRTHYRELTNGRVAYWDDATGTVVIRNPKAVDGGTAFRPTNGKAYFDGLK